MVVFAVVAETNNVLAWFRSEWQAKVFHEEQSKRPEPVFRAVAIVPMLFPERVCDIRDYADSGVSHVVH